MAQESASQGADVRLQVIQQQTREVSDIVRQNIDKLLESGELLEDVEQKALVLEFESERMKKMSSTVSRRTFCEKSKNTMFIGDAVPRRARCHHFILCLFPPIEEPSGDSIRPFTLP